MASFSSCVTWMTWDPGGATIPSSSSSDPSASICRNAWGSLLMMRNRSGLVWPTCCKRGCSKFGLVCTSCRNCWNWGADRRNDRSELPPPPCCSRWACWAAAANRFCGVSSSLWAVDGMSLVCTRLPHNPPYNTYLPFQRSCQVHYHLQLALQIHV